MRPAAAEIIRRKIRSEMALRNLTTEDLAKAINRSTINTRNVLLGWKTSKAMRKAIEGFFGTKFWTHEN